MPAVPSEQSEATAADPFRPAPRPASSARAAQPLRSAAKDDGKSAPSSGRISPGAGGAAYNSGMQPAPPSTEALLAQLSAQMQAGFAEIRDIKEQVGRLTEQVGGLKEQVAEIKGICHANSRRLDEQGRRLDEHGQMLRALAEAGAARDVKLEVLGAETRALKEYFDVRLKALETQVRLVWGALGVLVTVLLAVFGFLFTR